MTSYIGTKQINAKPMNRLDYNVFRGWELPADENGADDGYLVEYADGGQANTEEYSGYVSWSPKDVFERAYKPNNTFEDRLQIEHSDTLNRVTTLCTYLASEHFNTLDPVTKDLLITQFSAMQTYVLTMESRMNVIELEPLRQLDG
jgi:hypothetical protein